MDLVSFILKIGDILMDFKLNNIRIQNPKAFVFSLSFIGIILILEILYRPFIIRSDSFDFGFAGSFTNIFSVPAAAFLFLSFNRSPKFLYLTDIALIALGFVIYEFIQLTEIIGTFDLNDLIGIALGMVVTIVIQRVWFE
jgi:hypothetical protein